MSNVPDKGALIAELGERVRDLEPLVDEEDFITSPETLARFLKAREWKMGDAEKLLRNAVEWRRKQNPLHVDCTWCHDKPGFHSMRHIGFDEMGRPVMYSNFSQAATLSNSPSDSITHFTYLIENAKKTMPIGVSTWVFVIDCTGMAIQVCNPRLAYDVTQIMSNQYPERLGLVICVNHNRVFQTVWNAIKVFLHPNTVSKSQLVRSKRKVKATFEKYFSAELTEWLLTEMAMNKQRPLPASQRKFWCAPPSGVSHDPRGCPSYVKQYVSPCYKNDRFDVTTYKPHPNILSEITGSVNHLTTDDMSVMASANDGACVHSDDDDEDDDAATTELQISEEFKAPKDITSLHM